MIGLSPLNPRLDALSGKRVWIIGASSGIGAALARQMLAAGALVALSARRADGLTRVAGHSKTALVLPMDVTNAPAWTLNHRVIEKLWGGLDLVIFCAADYQPQRAWQVVAERARHTIEVNLASVYLGLETILPPMLREGKGHLAIVASVAGYMGLPNATVYGPTKAALINLAEILYCDLHPRGLGVTLINPGFVKTPLTARNQFSMPAMVTADEAATAITHGLAQGQFEISFPRRFTLPLRWFSHLPRRWRFAALDRMMERS
ncbi:SDR family NAD(P)-dependent oxidoreductase [Silvimonas iriomotensis]|uniref:Oxidoreductase n=1 Tax=Silvimonas iriomotensis TaxID=449662 RepID=A0ABQ2P9L9_9NEIS|nr:SDR family NAD(P)-dependent oxidoreductase [Silvimonas iriomotensis]GGP21170.1 oxidoreductase [Silvimonas iriomotensis]